MALIRVTNLILQDFKANAIYATNDIENNSIEQITDLTCENRIMAADIICIT